MQAGKGRNLEIEALGGVAILLVLFAHLGSLATGDSIYGWSRLWLQLGTGVDLFFCISGYVITRHLIGISQSDRKWPSFVRFAGTVWIRRFFRLAPSAWLWLAVLLAFSYVVDDPTNFTRNLYHTFAAFFQLANFQLYECRKAVTEVVCGRQGYFWSLSLEEQFYLLFPFMLFFFTRRMLLVAVSAIILLQLFDERTQLLWVIRTDSLAFGVLIALLEQWPGYGWMKPNSVPYAWARWLAFLLFVGVIACVEAPNFLNAFTGRYQTGIVAVFSALLIFLSSFDAGLAVPPGLPDVLIYFGARSYALYLIHVPTSWVIPRMLQALLGRPADPMTLCIVVYAATWAATELNYRYLETPLRRCGAVLARRFANLRFLDPAAAGVDRMAVKPVPMALGSAEVRLG